MMNLFEFGLLVLFFVKTGNCLYFLRPDLPEIKAGILEKGKPIQVPSNYSRVQIAGIKGTLYSDSLSLIHLRELRIKGLNVTSIERGAFCASPSLRILEVNFFNTEVPNLRKEAFENCNNLEELHVTFYPSQRPPTINVDALEGASNLKKLTLWNYLFTRLSRAAFLGVNKNSLQYFECSSCDIEDIDSDAFEGFNNLEGLNLVSNKLSAFPKGLFKKLPKLKFLHLRSNDLKDLTWDEFEGAFSIVSLDIASNDISSFDVDKIANFMPSLKFLNMANNPLTCNQKEAVAKELQVKIRSLEHVIYKSVHGHHDSCEEQD